MLKCVVSDVDGTLLPYGTQKVSDRLIEQIRELARFGVRFVAASGRTYANLTRVFAPVKDRITYIAENGTLCVHGGKILYQNTLPYELAYSVMRDILASPNCELLVSTPRVCLLQPKTEAYVSHVRNVMDYDAEVVENITSVKDDFLKVSAMDFGGIDRSAEAFIEKYGDRMDAVTSGNYWMDFTGKGINKGHTLRILLEKLGIDPKDAIAFGDQRNDLEMLELCGCGCAVENASPEIRECAQRICARVEDVLEEELEKLRIIHKEQA